ncbi:YdaS family helix-turn-helix protein [Paraburkholderia sp. HD33-4]|uniref:YdaS family helix-turn-helix protein n=1 Tax=Paraburkholderia sp. HD33-4 TaxID=2883242 RepID=UPI001F33C4FC|nr:YdaS family helix-turn-helix protein [Paraburkholderia sp. HD33-4]
MAPVRPSATQRRQARRGLEALDLACDLAGTQFVLAEAIGVSSATISSWRNRYERVPLTHVPHIVEFANDPRVTPMTLRPDYQRGWLLLSKQLATLRPPLPRTRLRKPLPSGETGDVDETGDTPPARTHADETTGLPV